MTEKPKPEDRVCSEVSVIRAFGFWSLFRISCFGFRASLRGVIPFLVLLIAFLSAGRSRMLHDPGTLWHTVVGERILATGELPLCDTFTFTRQGRPWIAQQWLTECLMALLHRIGGLDALLLLAAALLAATFAMLYRRMARAGISPPFAAILVALAIAASSHHFHARPHLLTIALSACVYAMLVDIDAGRRSAMHLWRLVPIFVLWTSSHGGAMGGLFTLMLAAGAWTVSQVIGRIRASSPSVAEHSVLSPQFSVLVLVFVLVLCLLAPLANPYGIALPRVWMSLMASDLLPRIIQEHAPPSPASSEFWMYTLLVGAYLAALATTGVRRIRLIWLLPLAWAVLGYTRIRHGPIFAVMAPIALAGMLPHARLFRGLALAGGGIATAPADVPLNTAPKRRFISSRLVVGIVLVAALGFQHAGVRIPLIGAGWAIQDPGWWPVDALPALRDALRRRDRPVRILNDMLFGGFLVYHCPEARIAFDDRCELFGDAGLREYVALQNDAKRLREWLAKHEVDVALVRTGSSLDRRLRAMDGWVIEHEDATSTLLVREAGGLTPSVRMQQPIDISNNVNLLCSGKGVPPRATRAMHPSGAKAIAGGVSPRFDAK